jgi:hypothetical protein
MQMPYFAVSKILSRSAEAAGACGTRPRQFASQQRSPLESGHECVAATGNHHLAGARIRVRRRYKTRFDHDLRRSIFLNLQVVRSNLQADRALARSSHQIRDEQSLPFELHSTAFRTVAKSLQPGSCEHYRISRILCQKLRVTVPDSA